jgi:UPF0755 protein
MRFILRWTLRLLLLLGVAAAAGYWWITRPLSPRTTPLEFSIAPGSSARSAATQIAAQGTGADATSLYWLARLAGEARNIKAGSYELEGGESLWTLLRMVTRGDQVTASLTVVEGWTFRQLRRAIAEHPNLRHDTVPLSDAALMASIVQGTPQPPGEPEGRFFPDTYVFAKGASDLDVYRRAWRAMNRQLETAWAERDPSVALRSPYEALILASIIEKETGRAADRPMIGAVFNNRLRLGMMLQTDPTVIYGMGEAFDGNLRKRDLQADTPFNTYTRSGLPPTPICLPGQASLLAAVRPAASKALYFVARGDGSSEFSETLEAHNRAVRKYQLGQ